MWDSRRRPVLLESNNRAQPSTAFPPWNNKDSILSRSRKSIAPYHVHRALLPPPVSDNRCCPPLLSTPTPDCGHAWQTYHSKDWYVDRCCLRCTRVFVSPVYIYTILSFEERERLEEPPPRWNYLLDTGWEIVCFFWRGKGLDDFVSSEGRMGGVNEESWTRKVPGVNWFITWPQFL